MRELCQFYGVARGTGYKWVERYDNGGLEGLQDLSRAPHRHPNEVSTEIEDLVISVREKHPSWGAPKIHARLKRDHGDKNIPVESTIGAILKRKRINGEPKAASQEPAGKRTVGACRCAECSLVRGL